MRWIIILMAGIVLLTLTSCSPIQAERALELAEGKLNARQYFILGWTLEKEGHFEQALEAYDNALELQPDHLPTRLRRFYALQPLKHWPEAATELESMISLDPTWTKLKVVIDVIDEENWDTAVKRYRRNVLPHLTNQDIKTQVEGWLEEIEKGVLTIK